ncbi:MAG: hypothetical protein ABWY16_12410 [Pedobacter sp.]|uniref:alpha/beta hydrolase family protein n=1 Tax=Pedobacter sp. TaxID=1411316 RepID=UPI00339604A4
MRFYNVLILLFLFPLVVCSQTSEALIGERTFHFTDTLRERKLSTEIWYPTHDTGKPSLKKDYPFMVDPTVRDGIYPSSKHPLILLSHGTGGSRMTQEWLADILVKNGFVVAAVDHWGNTYDHKNAIDFVTPWQRSLDISFVLTQLLKDNSLNKIIDSRRIGAAGFSIGGYTVLALAGAKLDLEALNKFSETPEGIQETNIPEFPDLLKSVDEAAVRVSFLKSPPLKDNRIKAFFAMSPAIGQGFISKEQFTSIDHPIYIIAAQSDSIAPVKTNAAHYHKLIPKSQLYIISGKTGHYVFLNEATPELKKTGAPIFNDDKSVDRHAVHELTGAVAVRFFKKTL